MQHPRSVAGQPLQSCGIVPKRRKVPPHLGLPFLQRLRQSPDCPSRFFVSPPQPVLPLRRFCRRVAAITVGTTTATAQQAQRNNPFCSSPSRCPRCEQPRPKTTPRRPSIAKQTRSAAGKRGHRTKTHPLFRDFPQLFRASPRARPNAPRQRPRSVRPAASLRAKTPSALTFFAFRFASLPIPPYLCAHTCPQNFAPSVVKWP